ncbi:MAG: hypothetical protein QNJ44_05985 [Rhodobacter sp.]|nr:hypothetical protein [Rhodobacter sp.]
MICPSENREIRFTPGEANPTGNWLYFQLEEIEDYYAWVRRHGIDYEVHDAYRFAEPAPGSA